MHKDLKWFPQAAGLTLAGDAIRRIDTRVQVPTHHFQRFGIDFTPDELTGFIDEILLASPELRGAILSAKEALGENSVTVHVRRGDYYSDSRYRPRYAMDLNAYLTAGLRMAIEVWQVDKVVIVSDDPAWCLRHLAWVADFGLEPQPPPQQESAMHDFGYLCASEHLILANSSFSQWGAHISSALGVEPNNVIAPTFGVRGINGGRAWQLNPQWRVVDNADEEQARMEP